jgi:hypothetical protein
MAFHVELSFNQRSIGNFSVGPENGGGPKPDTLRYGNPCLHVCQNLCLLRHLPHANAGTPGPLYVGCEPLQPEYAIDMVI